MNAGTLTLVYVFAKVGIFFQINAIITKKSVFLSKICKTLHTFVTAMWRKPLLLRSF